MSRWAVIVGIGGLLQAIGIIAPLITNDRIGFALWSTGIILWVLGFALKVLSDGEYPTL